MAVTTVAQFAAELNRPSAALLEQLQSAGVAKRSPDDKLTDADKERLLEFLRSAHGSSGAERKKITLTRKSTSEIKQADASGKARTIQVEVRKKRVFVKREDAPSTPVAGEPPAPVIDAAEVQRREAEAARQAELMRRQDEDAARRAREEQERRDREAATAAEAAARAEAAAASAAAAAPAAPATPVASEAAATPAPAAPAKPALRVVKSGSVEAAERARQAEADGRRKSAEAEAAAIRAMMAAPKKVLTAKKPEEAAKPGEAGKEGIKGTIHQPKAAAGATAAPGTTTAKPGDKKSVKSEKLSSSWADDAAKKRALKTRGDSGGARAGWRAPRGARKGDRSDDAPVFTAPAEFVVQEVHIPETISVADLAHKMSVKASEVI
ncbi:MAG TPA: translation initiation factor IF-2 associated domain-containing protein, partial [Burkholderiaceae bacterium]|nr:translation initiation factor IF-2 associated domain-containing protein [Burkholderiaceae bacterium]